MHRFIRRVPVSVFVVCTVGLVLSPLLVVAASSPAAAAPTFHVNTTADAADASTADGICATASNKCSLRAAVQQARESSIGTIVVPSGTYKLTVAGTDDIAATGDLDVWGARIVGAGAGTTIVDGQGNDRVFDIYGPTAISGLTIQHGNAGSAPGGAVRINAKHSLALSHVVVRDNTTSGPGAGIYDAGTLTVSRSVIQANNGSPTGGGIDVETRADAFLGHLRVLNNHGGGGIYNSGYLSLRRSTVKGNSTAGVGGGLSLDGPGLITQTTIADNTAPAGGGLNIAQPATLVNDTIYGNNAQGFGGGVNDCADTTFVHVTITHNLADSDNSGGGYGGGVYGCDWTGTFRNSIVGGNLMGSTGLASSRNCYDDGGTHVVSLGHNVFGAAWTAHCSYSLVSSDKRNVGDSSLKLGAFGFHAGWNSTVPVFAASPAIKLATRCSPTDQRGVRRPKNHCDSGAYERSPA